MSYEELDRVRVIERVIEKRLTQAEAARILGLTSRQVRRLRRGYERDGARALTSKRGSAIPSSTDWGEETENGRQRQGPLQLVRQ